VLAVAVTVAGGGAEHATRRRARQPGARIAPAGKIEPARPEKPDCQHEAVTFAALKIFKGKAIALEALAEFLLKREK